MKRRLLDFLTVLSLLLFVAVVAVQIRAYAAGSSTVVIRETIDAVYLAKIDSTSLRVMSRPPRDPATRDGRDPSPTGGSRIVLDMRLKLLTVLSGALPSVWLSRRLRRAIAPTDPCPACGYDLTGNVSGVCPECGQMV